MPETIAKCYITTWAVQGSLHDLLAWPVTKDSRVGTKSSRVWNVSVFTNTYDYRYHSEAGECISTSGISTLPLWIYVSMTCSDTRGRGPTTDLAVTEGIRPPNLPNLLVLDESLLPAWRLTSKISISTSGISALRWLPILCLGACLPLLRKHKGRCGHVHLVSRLIRLNQESPGTPRSSNATR